MNQLCGVLNAYYRSLHHFHGKLCLYACLHLKCFLEVIPMTFQRSLSCKQSLAKFPEIVSLNYC